MNNELKLCPFCGGKAELWLDFEQYRTKFEYDEKNVYHCGCKNCGIIFSSYWEKEHAIEQWNRRICREV